MTMYKKVYNMIGAIENTYPTQCAVSPVAHTKKRDPYASSFMNEAFKELSKTGTTVVFYQKQVDEICRILRVNVIKKDWYYEVKLRKE